MNDIAVTQPTRILAVAPWVPSSRRPRSFGLLSMLAEHSTVELVAAAFSDEDEQDAKSLPFRTHTIRLSKRGAVFRAVRALFGRASLQQAYMDSPAMRRAIRHACDDFKPDAVYFNTLRSAQWIDEVGPARRLIDLDEFRSGYYSQLARTRRWSPSKLIGILESKRMLRAEVRISKLFDRVIVSSPLDCVGRGQGIRLVRSPHLMASETDAISTPRRPSSNAPEIVFVGRMNYGANVRAISWFVRHVFPLVEASIPGARLLIVGSDPPESVRKLAKENVDVLGRVEEVEPFYRSSHLSVIPVTEATGVQMKLIESLHCQTAVVTTALVAAQAGVAPGREVLVASTAQEWADAVTGLLSSPERRLKLIKEGKVWVSAHYDRRAIELALLSAIGSE